jgi:hypothetical protein
LAQLRSYVYIDSLQPQFAALLGTMLPGFLPLPGDASLWIEVSPGIEINRITDIALKAAMVRPGVQMVERLYGSLEIHSSRQGEVKASGAAILQHLGVSERSRVKPQMILAGQTLFVLEVEPAAYIALATNEAAKAASINILEVSPFGSFGRMYLGGEERDIVVAHSASISAIENIYGQESLPNGRRE